MVTSDPWNAPYLLLAGMNIDAAHEATFNSIYDEEHLPFLQEVPGVRAIARYESQSFQMLLGGELRVIRPSFPRYQALYAFDRADVTASDEWGRAVESGRWPTQVRPFTRDRLHVLMKNRSVFGNG
jgi:hypothetical protein